ncbi:axin interaction partner and dorsalization antagonist [Plakobranchus ocellatus]|uniref:Axin interaction partner and dorsalization antagonist n=1 Tax=Plakobranchus ocellatus TaxID=259542 RepID=A0AAV4C7N7_9GAST|nr:axin interaction partner and dorsalization antagonist [Plakobranchus ocellatus]
MESEKDTLVVAWINAFKRAADFDAWGQRIEAIDVYERLSRQLHSSCGNEDVLLFNESQKKILEKIALCLDSRKRALQLSTSRHLEGLPLTDLRRLENKGTLLPRPLPIAGKTLLTVKIEKIDLKEASQYLDPFITVSVRDANEKLLSASQDTPVASRKTESELIFNKMVHIQKTIESLPPGFAIFFEFKHYKPKKESISTKCWALMEQDELKEGHLALEIYRKPTDYSRKALKLLSVKPYYLHLQLSLFR